MSARWGKSTESCEIKSDAHIFQKYFEVINLPNKRTAQTNRAVSEKKSSVVEKVQ